MLTSQRCRYMRARTVTRMRALRTHTHAHACTLQSDGTATQIRQIFKAAAGSNNEISIDEFIRRFAPPEVHIHIHTSMHACIHTYIHTYIHTHIHTYIHTHTHTHTHTHQRERRERQKEREGKLPPYAYTHVWGLQVQAAARTQSIMDKARARRAGGRAGAAVPKPPVTLLCLHIAIHCMEDHPMLRDAATRTE